MIRVVMGNVLDSQLQTRVNTVNCVGIMGKGIAKEFKEAYPSYFKDYRSRCEQGLVKLGRPYPYKLVDGRILLSFPTKDHWRNVTRLSDVVAGLEHLKVNYRSWGIESLAVPPLGCGNGQLEWSVVGPTLYRHLAELDIPVELYAPHGTPHRQLRPAFLSVLAESANEDRRDTFISPELVAVVEVLHRLEAQSYAPPVGRTMFEKALYFLAAAGIDDEQRFKRGTYGPYDESFKRILSRLTNNGLITENRQGPMIRIAAGPTYGDAASAYSQQLEAWNQVIERVVDLLARVDTRSAELLATLVYVARRLETLQGGPPSESDVADAFLEWKLRKKPAFDKQEIHAGIEFLDDRHWIRVA